MFAYSFAHWLTFLSAAFLLNLSPGPDMAFILSHSVSGGRRAGFAAMFGLWNGTFVHIIFAALGLSAILLTSATAYTLVKWIGALYLIWLGIKALRSQGFSQMSVVGQAAPDLAAIFRQGVLVSALNPKVAIFFLAFLPQFVEPGAGPVSAQLFLHGVLILMTAALVEPLVVLLGGRLAEMVEHNTVISRWMDRGLGVLLIGLGLKLASSANN